MRGLRPHIIIDEVHAGTSEFVAKWKTMTPVERLDAYIPDDGMAPVVIPEDDAPSLLHKCPHCRQGFKVDDVVLESHDRQVQIHAQCVIEMYHRLPFTPEAIDSDYERVREELITGLELHDE